MYRIFCPVAPASPTFDPAAALADLHAAGADLVYLVLPNFGAEGLPADVLAKTARAADFFRENGMEVGVWFWSHLVEGRPDFTPQRSVTGEESHDDEKCFLDENFLSYMEKQIKAIAALHPDRIQLDDDFRLAAWDIGFGCTCARHLRSAEAILGKPFPNGDLFDLAFSGKPNEYRAALLRSWGDSLRGYAEKIRAWVDEVDPKIRVGVCACGSYDLDGTDIYEIAKILAGKTKPFLRLSGAPYWSVFSTFGVKAHIPDVIELERMQASWRTGDVEVVSEGDTYPRPTWKVPAAYGELFDSALAADGSLDGILKYLFDYSAPADYERKYLRTHIANRSLREEIARLFADKTPRGIRVYSPKRKIGQADLSGKPHDTEFLNSRFFSTAARSLSCAAIPTVWAGGGCAGIAFGEDARHLPREAFDRPLILDLGAAKILSASGVDVGLVHAGEPVAPEYLNMPARATHVSVFDAKVCAAPLTLSGTAKVSATFSYGGTDSPFAYTYQNKDGGRFLVFAFDADLAGEEIFRNYLYPALIADALSDFGTPLPVRIEGATELYALCKSGEDALALGLWNCGADAAECTVTTPVPWKDADFVGISGTARDGKCTITVPAFSFGAIILK